MASQRDLIVPVQVGCDGEDMVQTNQPTGDKTNLLETKPAYCRQNQFTVDKKTMFPSINCCYMNYGILRGLASSFLRKKYKNKISTSNSTIRTLSIVMLGHMIG